MTKLMHQNGTEGRMVAGGNGELVVNATSAIRAAIDQHDDMFEGNATEQVVNAMHLTGHEIAIRIKRIIMGTSRCLSPNSKMRNRRTAFG